MLKRRYYSAIAVLQNRVRRWTSLPDKDPILVYSMRKVGSTTVTKTLRTNGIRVYKLHLLNLAMIAQYRKSFAEAGGRIDHSIVEGISFRRRLERWRKKRVISHSSGRLKIFTFVKDPISIAVSDFFMQLFYFLPHVVHERGLDAAGPLADLFGEAAWSAAGRQAQDPVIAYLGKMCALPCVWFEQELNELTGVDVFQAPFDKDGGVGYYSGSDSDICLIRTDKLSHVGLTAINTMTGANLTELLIDNVRSQSAEGRLYQEFSKQVRLPEDLVRTLCAMARMEHFFSPDEIEAMVERWGR